jgi:acetoin utilization protein AcuB
MKMMTIQDLMTADPLCVQADDTLLKVRNIFDTHGFHHVPVIHEGRCIGIISRSDLNAVHSTLPFYNQKLRELKDTMLLNSMLVSEVMTRQVVTLRPDDDIHMAIDLFLDNTFHAIPILDRNDYLCGIITPFDILGYVFREKMLI